MISYERSGTPVGVDSAIAIHVYRVLQEALNNMGRHSGAVEAWVRLAFHDQHLALEIEDHGRGIAGDTARRGLGIVAMRERAAIVGGRLEFCMPSAGGTLVRLTVPLAAAGPAELNAKESGR